MVIHETLITGIKAKLLPLGDDVQFLSGHGPSSTLGEERQNNPLPAGLRIASGPSFSGDAEALDLGIFCREGARA